MSIVITGATGRIGQETMALLRATGAPVHVLTRNLALATDLFGDFAEVHEWHPLTSPPPATAFRGVEVVLNLMGEPVSGRWSAVKMQRVIQSRLVSTERLVHALRDHRVRLVSASSFAIYPGRAEDNYVEGTPLEAPDNPMQKMVQDWERAALVAKRTGSSVAVLRYGMVSGGDARATDAGSDAEDTHTLRPLFPHALAATCERGFGVLMGDGSQRVPVIDVHDAARMTVWAATEPDIEGPINAVAPGSVSLGEVAGQIGTTLGRGPRVKVPSWAARPLLGPSACTTLGSFAIQPAVAMAGGFRFAHPDGTEIIARALAARAKAIPAARQDAISAEPRPEPGEG